MVVLGDPRFGAASAQICHEVDLGGSGKNEITGLAIDQNSNDVFVTGFTS
jgi:hypothetical protein